MVDPRRFSDAVWAGDLEAVNAMIGESDFVKPYFDSVKKGEPISVLGDFSVLRSVESFEDLNLQSAINWTPFMQESK